MKTDWRILGRPHRGTRRKIVLHCGFSSKKKAEAFLDAGVVAGTIDPEAWIQSCRVSDGFDPVKAAQSRPVWMG